MLYGAVEAVLPCFPKINSCVWPCTHMQDENEAVDMLYSRAVSLQDV